MNEREPLHDISLFDDLPAEALAHIRDRLQEHAFERGQALFQAGDPGDALYIIAVGSVRIFVPERDDQETAVALLSRGDICGELALIDGLPRSATAEALAPTRTYRLAKDDFWELAEAHPQLALNFMRVLSRRVRANTRRLVRLSADDVLTRLAAQLVELGNDYGALRDGVLTIDAILTRSDLAGLIGASREKVIAALDRLGEANIIDLRHGQIVILDMPAMLQYAQLEP